MRSRPAESNDDVGPTESDDDVAAVCAHEPVLAFGADECGELAITESRGLVPRHWSRREQHSEQGECEQDAKLREHDSMKYRTQGARE